MEMKTDAANRTIECKREREDRDRDGEFKRRAVTNYTIPYVYVMIHIDPQDTHFAASALAPRRATISTVP